MLIQLGYLETVQLVPSNSLHWLNTTSVRERSWTINSFDPVMRDKYLHYSVTGVVY